MFKKITILSFLVLFFSTLVLAENVPLNTVKQVAKNAYYEFSGIKQNNQIFSEPYIISKDNNNLYYVFNVEKHGYIIVSSDDRVVPILGYSLTGHYSENGQPPQFQSWMQGYAEQIEYVIEKDIKSTNTIQEKWQKYTQSFDDFTFEKNTKNVDPLLDPIAWDQGNGWNSYCPEDNAGPGGHVYAGCVATAAGMVMKYWEHPTTGAGSETYYCYPYGTISVDFSEATYDWASMSDTYSTNAAALLLYHVGVSVQMQYAPDGSGAYTSDLENSLKNNFYYKPSIDFQEKANHPSDWESILVNELDSARPIVYKGSSDASGGHAFCCDGYSSGGSYFHFNWGWSGYYNGYFYLSNLNPGGYYNFTDNQGAVIGIEPDDEPPPTLDPPQNFQLTLDSNNITLTWESPFGGGDGFEDGFETYDDFLLDFGEWTQLDIDGGPTWGANNFDFANEGYTGSFIIFNPASCSPANPTGWDPHTGSKFAACFDTQTASAPNDDWLITPLISIETGDAVNFWAKSITDQYGLERFQVGVSTTGTDPGDFTIISDGSYEEAPITWTEYTYSLSDYDGQDVYVAIHVVSNDAFCFFLDDFVVGSDKSTKYANGFENQDDFNKINDIKVKQPGQSIVAKHTKKTGQKGLLGFQVYRDEQPLGSQLPADQIEYLDEDLPSNTYTYYITAVYDEGESVTTDTLEATITIGMKELQKMISIYPNPVREVLNIQLLSNESFNILLRDITGRLVRDMKGSGQKAYINVSDFNKGLYFIEIRTENDTLVKKIIIK